MKYVTVRLGFLTVLFLAQFASTSSGGSLTQSVSASQLPQDFQDKISQAKKMAVKKTPRPTSTGSDMQTEPQSSDRNGAPSYPQKGPKVGKIRIVDSAGKVTEIDGDSAKQKE